MFGWIKRNNNPNRVPRYCAQCGRDREHANEVDSEPVHWVTKEGDHLLPEDMTTGHIINTLNLFCFKHEDRTIDPTRHKALLAIMEELRRRVIERVTDSQTRIELRMHANTQRIREGFERVSVNIEEATDRIAKFNEYYQGDFNRRY